MLVALAHPYTILLLSKVVNSLPRAPTKRSDAALLVSEVVLDCSPYLPFKVWMTTDWVVSDV